MENILDSMVIDNTPRDNGPRPGAVAEEVESADALPYDLSGVLARFDALMADDSHMASAHETLIKLPPGTGGYDGRAEAIASIVAAREATKQSALRLLEKMHDELKSTGKRGGGKKANPWSGIDLQSSIAMMDSGDLSEFLLELARIDSDLMQDIDIGACVAMMESEDVSEFLLELARITN